MLLPLERKLKAVANRRRLEILLFLNRAGEANVAQVADHVHGAYKYTSWSLRRLAAVDLLVPIRRGNCTFYRLAPSEETRFWIRTIRKFVR